MKNILPILIIFLSLFNVSAQANLIQNIAPRTVLNLDGQWDAIVDIFDKGFNSGSQIRDSSGFFKDDKSVPYGTNPKSTRNSELVEYSFDEAQKIKVPGDWNSQDDKLFFYEGAIWYRKVFNYSPQKDKRTFLYFDAANYEAHVYLNGKRLGQHVGGFTPFQFETTGLLKEGENRVYVYVKTEGK